MSHFDDCSARLAKSKLLEEAYKESLHTIDINIKDEDARKLRLKILILENENDELHQQLALADDQNDLLREASETLRERLERSQENASHCEQEIGHQKRVVNKLRAEVSSFKTVSSDSTKLLTEKLAIVRELSVLQTEVEYLRSQASYQQTILSEKLALQRQVRSLEVELEAEKRASERAAQRDDSSKREMDLKYQLNELQKDIIRMREEGRKPPQDSENEHGSEKRGSKRMIQRGHDNIEALAGAQQQQEGNCQDLVREDRENGWKCEEPDSRRKASGSRESVLESELEQTQTRLRATKEQFKALQTELRLSHNANPKAEGLRLAPKNSKKRVQHEMSTNDPIGTPDGSTARGKRLPMKKSKMDQTMVGEKSMFSITPFLNRTTNKILEDSNDGADNEVDRDREGRPRPGAAVANAASLLTANYATDFSEQLVPKKYNLEESKTCIEESHKRRTNSVGTLQSVPEEKDQRNGPSQKHVLPQTLQQLQSVTSTLKLKPSTILSRTDDNHAGPTKKKRKLLAGGQTLFDEDEKETVRRPLKASLGNSQRTGKIRLADSKNGVRSGANTMCAFSPLKKDRRGVGASFLS